MTALFAFLFAAFGVACGSYCLGRILAQLASALWLWLRQKKKDR